MSSILTTMLLTDVKKGGPGSGPHPSGGSSRETHPEVRGMPRTGAVEHSIKIRSRIESRNAHSALRSAGFKATHVTDRGTGMHSVSTTHYSHPEGHTASISRSGSSHSGAITVNAPKAVHSNVYGRM